MCEQNSDQYMLKGKTQIVVIFFLWFPLAGQKFCNICLKMSVFAGGIKILGVSHNSDPGPQN